jgi:choline dehydrogenase-like flavoprotein
MGRMELLTRASDGGVLSQLPVDVPLLMSYDDVIAGAGSCGAVLAARLSEDRDRRVLLLEAGPDYRSVAETPADLLSGWMSLVDHDWGTTAMAVAERSISYARGKVVGGSSAVNGTVALRGHPGDFEEWVARGLPEWSWSEVLSVYRRLEDDPQGAGLDPEAHSVGGPVPISRVPRAQWQPVHAAFHAACVAAGFPDCEDFNAPAATGAGVWPRDTRDGVRMSSALPISHRLGHDPTWRSGRTLSSTRWSSMPAGRWPSTSSAIMAASALRATASPWPRARCGRPHHPGCGGGGFTAHPVALRSRSANGVAGARHPGRGRTFRRWRPPARPHCGRGCPHWRSTECPTRTRWCSRQVSATARPTHRMPTISRCSPQPCSTRR